KVHFQEFELRAFTDGCLRSGLNRSDDRELRNIIGSNRQPRVEQVFARESVITRLRMVATHRNSPLLQAINDARLFKIVGRHLKLYAITNRKTNESLAHFPT